MLDTLRKIGFILLIGLLLTPSIVKIEHHHDGFVCKVAHNEKHFHTYHHTCLVCAFEFSLFSLAEKNPISPLVVFPEPKNDRKHFFKPFTTSDYSFLLRAPPIICA